MELLKCYGCGISTSHPPKTFYKNYKGSKDWLLMCFNTDFIYYKDKKMYNGKKFQCIINAPHSPAIHGPGTNITTGFENDWIYISGDTIDQLIAKLELPINESFSVVDTNCLTPYLTKIKKEEKMPMYYSKQYISNILQSMLISIARQRRIAEYKANSAYESVKEVRRKMLENYTQKLNLNALAAESGYSVSRFCDLYKEFFSGSPIEDLINMRIKEAKNYLLLTDKSIGEISGLCGFESIHYFSGMFKKKVKYSPAQYRKLHEKGENL